VDQSSCGKYLPGQLGLDSSQTLRSSIHSYDSSQAGQYINLRILDIEPNFSSYYNSRVLG